MMTNGIDPKVGLWVNAGVCVLSLLAAGSLAFPGVPDGIVSAVKTYAADGVAVITALNLVFGWYSSNTSGPGVINK
jgi:hypothetical protein